MRPGKFPEDIGNGTGAVVPVNVKSRTFAQPELGLLCGGNKNRAFFWDEFKAMKPRVLGLVDDAHTTAAQFLDDAVVGNRAPEDG
jgi:hypothetical protein